MSEVKFRKPICPQGHDKRVVGTYGYSCAACRAEMRRRRQKRGHVAQMRNPYCKNGHYKPAVGYHPENNACNECARVRGKRWRRKQRAIKYRTPVELFGAREIGLPTLRQLRESLGLTRPQLERLSGVSRFTIIDIERGRSKGYPTTRKKLIDAFSTLLAKRNNPDRLRRTGLL